MEKTIDRMFSKIGAAPEIGNSRDLIPTGVDPVGGHGPRGVLRTKRRNTAEKERERDQDCKPSGKQDFQSLMRQLSLKVRKDSVLGASCLGGFQRL